MGGERGCTSEIDRPLAHTGSVGNAIHYRNLKAATPRRGSSIAGCHQVFRGSRSCGEKTRPSTLFFENLVLALLWWRDFSRDDGQLGREAIELGIRQRLRRGERT